MLRLAGWINVESRVTVGCAGAVLTYLQRKQADSLRGGDEITVAIIEMWSMNDIMFASQSHCSTSRALTSPRFVNADTICALQIFEDESHPNFHMQGPHGRGKEGLSLFGNFLNQGILAFDCH